MLIKKASDIKWSEVTPKSVYMNRRKFLAGAAVAAGAAFAAGPASSWLDPQTAHAAGAKLAFASKSPFSTTEKETPYQSVTTYNNFYEFGTDKSDPARNATEFRDQSLVGQRRRRSRQAPEILRRRSHGSGAARRAHLPPSLRRSLVDRRALDRLLAERAINKVQPTPKAKFVQFFSDLDRKQMPGSSRARTWTGPIARACAWTKPCTR